MAVRFVPNPIGIAAIGLSPAMSLAMRGWGDYVAEIVEAIAPVGEGQGGHYKDQIRVESVVIDGAAGARVNAWKFTSGFLEFGTSDTPRYAPLRTALDSAGLQVAP